MGISEVKKKIVIENYFKQECDVNTTIREAYERGFNRGLSKAPKSDKPSGKWIECDDGWGGVYYDCSECGDSWTTIDGTPFENGMKYCPRCGARLENEDKV